KLRLLRLPEPVQERVVRQALTERHARALLRLEDPELQVKLAEEAEARGWTVQELERRVERHLPGSGDEERPARPSRRVVRVFKDKRLFRHSILSVVKEDRKSTRLNSSHVKISYAVLCLKKKKS